MAQNVLVVSDRLGTFGVGSGFLESTLRGLGYEVTRAEVSEVNGFKFLVRAPDVIEPGNVPEAGEVRGADIDGTPIL